MGTRRQASFNGWIVYPDLFDGTAHDPVSPCDDTIAVVPYSGGQEAAKFTEKYLDENGDEQTRDKVWGWEPDCFCHCACGVAVELDLGSVIYSGRSSNITYTRLPFANYHCDGFDWDGDNNQRYIAFWSYTERGSTPACSLTFSILFGNAPGDIDVGTGIYGPTVVNDGSLWYAEDPGGGDKNTEATDPDFDVTVPQASDWGGDLSIGKVEPVTIWPGHHVTTTALGTTQEAGLILPGGSILKSGESLT